MKITLAFALFAATAAVHAQVLSLIPADEAQKDRSPDVLRIVAAARPGDEIRFARGEYRFTQSLVLRDCTNLVFRGEEGTVFSFRFRANGLTSGAPVYLPVERCADVRIEGIALTADRPVSVSGRVIAIHPESLSYDVRLEGDSRLEGTEPLCTADTCDRTGAPDRVITWFNFNETEVDDGCGRKVRKCRGIPYRMLGADTLRVTAPRSLDFSRLEVGHRVVYRLSLWGGVCTVRNSDRIVFRNMTVWRSPGISFVISPRSSDITFDGLKICPRNGSGAIYSSNADGIHVGGMSGTLTLKNCLFVGFGDDPLNVHGKAAEVGAYDPSSGAASCGWRLFHGERRPMGAQWAAVGDELGVYDRATFHLKGSVRVSRISSEVSTQPGAYVLATASGTPAPAVGDILINAHDRPKVRVSNCTVRNVRSRGFLLQSSDVIVSDCSFAGTGGSGILVAPDIGNWYESGPANGLAIRRCRFERCGVRPSAFGAVTVKVNHEGPLDAFPAGVHRKIEISDCMFRACGCGATNVCVASASSVRVSACGFERQLTQGEPVVFVNCEDAAWDGFLQTLVVDNVRGDDANPGTAEKPFRTISRAVRQLAGGGLLKLVPNAEPYHEAIALRGRQHTGTREHPTTVDGGGAVIDGLVPPKAGGWKEEGDGVWSRHLDNNAWVMDGTGHWCGAFPLVRFGSTDGANVTSRTDLVEGSYFLFKRKDRGPGHNTLFVKTIGGRDPDEVPVSVVSPWMNASMYGCAFASIRNLTVRNQSWDCFSSGVCTNCVFENVDGSHAMDQGISAHGSIALTVKNSRFHHNAGGGIVDVNVPQTFYCQTTYENCQVVSNSFRCPVEFYGHSDGGRAASGDYRLFRCAIRDNDLSRTGGDCMRADHEARVVCESCDCEGRLQVLNLKVLDGGVKE